MAGTNKEAKTGAKTTADVPLTGDAAAKGAVKAAKKAPAAAPARPAPLVPGPNVTVGGTPANRLLLKHVGGLTILSTTARASLNEAETEVFDDIMYELRTMQRPLQRVENFSEFFDAGKQFARMSENTVPENRALAEAIGMPLTDAELEVLSNYRAIKAKVVAFFKDAGPQYPFVKRANGAKLTVTATHVSNGGYEMTHKQAETVWKRCRRVWESQDTKQAEGNISLNGYGTRHINVQAQSVGVGCQTLTRWQVEQAAIQLGVIEG
jgi:hypothetical protein